MGIYYTSMAAAQVVSEKIQAYSTDITNLQLADMPVCQTGSVLLCDVSTGYPRLIVQIYIDGQCLMLYIALQTLSERVHKTNIR